MEKPTIISNFLCTFAQTFIKIHSNGIQYYNIERGG
jgi:hypothetical protein